MPTTKPSPVATPIPAGEHMLTLHEVIEKEVDNHPNRIAKGEPAKVMKWLWRFLSDDLDPESDPPQPYELAVWTFGNYGHARANLTKLLDMIVPKATVEQKQSLNTDRIVGRRFKAMILHELNQKKEMVPVAKYIVPATENDPPAPQRVTAPSSDPVDEIPV